MKKKHSRIALIASLLIHGTLIGGGLMWLKQHKIEKTMEQENTLSMEMVAALLEQPQVAIAPESEEVKEPEPEKNEPEPKPDDIPDPTLKPKEEKPKKEKPKEEKRKEKPKPEKPKEEKPKEKKKDEKKERPKPDAKPIKALERGPEPKQGIVAKAIPNAVQGEKLVAGVVGGQKNGSQSSTSTTGSANGGNASELAAYKAALQRALQRKASNSYPTREKMMRKTGVVTLSFRVSASGAITNVAVANSSGNSNLDAAAAKSAESLSMPAPPAGFPPLVTVPVKFEIQ